MTLSPVTNVTDIFVAEFGTRNSPFDFQRTTNGTARIPASNCQQQVACTAPVEINGRCTQQPTVARYLTPAFV